VLTLEPLVEAMFAAAGDLAGNGTQDELIVILDAVSERLQDAMVAAGSCRSYQGWAQP
jgi:hypothetical protein